MRITLFLLLVSILQTFANDTYSQRTKLSVDFSDTKLEDVMDKIEVLTEFYFLYNEKLVDTDREVTLSVKNKKIEVILDKLFSDTDVIYTITDRKIILAPSFLSDNQQQKTISGTVTDDIGQPLPGVTVVIKGTTQGTVTNVDGNYLISDIPENAFLIFSFVGMASQEIAVGNQTIINIMLAVDAIGIEEVISIGYGSMKKRNMTSAVTQIKAEKLGVITTKNMGASLQGRLPGLYIRDGGYNKEMTVLVRGQTTIGNNSPLYIVDGIPQSIDNLDPNDIEKISVLKDAASTAIYGSRASAGVVLITTKSGKSGRMNITLQSYTGWGKPTSLQESLSSVPSAGIMNQASRNSGGVDLFTQDEINLFKAGTDHYYADTKWTDEILKTERTNRIYFSATGGNESTSYLFSIGYNGSNGIMEGIDNKRYTLRSNLKTKLFHNFEITANLSYTIDDNTLPNAPITAFWWRGIDQIYRNMNVISPFMPVRDAVEDGGRYSSLNKAGAYKRGFWNPAWSLNAGTSNTFGNVFSANTSFTWDIYKGLKFTGRYSGMFGNSNQMANILSRTASDGPPWNKDINSLSRTFTDNRQYNAQTFLSYEKLIGHHLFSILGGWDVQFNKSSFLTGGRQNYQFAELLTELDAPNSGNNNDIIELSSNTIESALQSAVGRLNYNFADKYMVELTGRYDGSSRFAPETRYGFFPAISAGWMISEEDFFGDKLFNYLKIRASYGLSGNNAVDGVYYSQIAFGSYHFNPGDIVGSTASEGSIPFRDLRWETTTSFNFGIDFSILENILSGEIDVYNKLTNDILLASPVQGVVGTNRTGPAINAGSVRNNGFEMILTHQNDLSNGFNYSVSVNLAYNKNEIMELTDAFSEYGNYRVGDPLGSVYGYVSEGLLRTDAEATAYLNSITSGVHPNTSAGDIKYKDINGDKKLDFEDKVLIAETIPQITYGFTLQANWKNFDLQAFFQGVGKAQQHVINDLFGNAAWIPVEALDAWSESNLDGTYPRPLLYAQQTYFQNFATTSDFWTFGAGYLRLKNIQLSYSIPIKNNKVVKKAQVFIASTNPWTVSNFRKGFDPEALTLDIPPLKTFSVGFNINF